MAQEPTTGAQPGVTPPEGAVTANPFLTLAEDAFVGPSYSIEGETDQEPTGEPEKAVPVEEEQTPEPTPPVNPYLLTKDEYRQWMTNTPEEEQRRALAELNPHPSETIWMQRGLIEKTQDFAEERRRMQGQIDTLTQYVQQLAGQGGGFAHPATTPTAGAPTPEALTVIDPYTGVVTVDTAAIERVIDARVQGQVAPLLESIQQARQQQALIELKQNMIALEREHPWFSEEVQTALYHYMRNRNDFDLQSAFRTVHMDDLINEALAKAAKPGEVAKPPEAPPTAPPAKARQERAPSRGENPFSRYTE